ncbi:hypothetical protein BASA81_008792 [Batrachochytrium salamandrivorans]|nr:hypothetical protein BASA81_008792 [Batrachochytrium salamandrivorans]
MSLFGLGSSDPLSAFGKSSTNDTVSDSYPLKISNSISTHAGNLASSASGAFKNAAAAANTTTTNGLGGVAAGASMGMSPFAFGLDLGKDEPNWAAFAVQHYLEAILTSPLMVVETLTDVQYQKRIDSNAEDDSYTNYESVHPGSAGRVMPLFLPRMHSDISSNLRQITDSELEGISGLFKGHVTNFLFPCSHWRGLVPLETIRTRLIVQATSSSRRRYFGPAHVLYSMASEERPTTFSSALSTIYTSRVLLPSILVHAAGAFVRFFSSRIIQEELGLDPAFSPMLFRFATLGFLAVEAAVVAPLEMVRKRLQVQRIDAFRASPNPAANSNSSKAQTFESVVETSAVPYTGMFNCIGSIIAEEGGKRPISRTTKKTSNLSAADWQDVYGGGIEKPATGVWSSVTNLSRGIATLYRGFWARYASTVILYISNEISQDDGW